MKTKIIALLLAGAANSIYSQCNPIVGNVLPASGDVGLGTGTPGNKLHIVTCRQNGGIVVDQVSTSQIAGAAAISLKNSSNAQGRHWMLASTGNGNIGNGGNFEIDDFGTGPYNPYTTAVNRFFIEGATGNIGIGSTSPSEQLHTTGGVRFQGVISGGAPTSMIVADINGKLWRAALPSTGACGTANFIAKDNGLGGVVCSQIFDNGTSVGIGTTGPFNYTWQGGLTGPTGAPCMGCSGTLRLSVNGVMGAVAYHATSDARFKKNIETIADAKDIISKLEGRTYLWRTDEYKDRGFTNMKQYGFIAQELEKVVPEAVLTDENGFKSVNYNMIIPILVQHAKDMQNELAEQRILLSNLMEKTVNATSLKEDTDRSATAVLEQNIPNPFNGTSTVNYKLPAGTTNASLMVCDLSGKKVLSYPIDANSSSVTLNSEKLSSGIYLYSIVANNQILETKRMVVEK